MRPECQQACCSSSIRLRLHRHSSCYKLAYSYNGWAEALMSCVVLSAQCMAGMPWGTAHYFPL